MTGSANWSCYKPVKRQCRVPSIESATSRTAAAMIFHRSCLYFHGDSPSDDGVAWQITAQERLKLFRLVPVRKNALFTIKLSMKLSWSLASGLLATSYSISQSKKLYFSLGFRFSEISAVTFVLWSANQKNRFLPLSQSLYWRPPADQKASGLWVRDCQSSRSLAQTKRIVGSGDEIGHCEVHYVRSKDAHKQFRASKDSFLRDSTYI